MDIITDNFETKQGTGWLIAAGVGAELLHKWYDIGYNIQLSENKIEISGRMTDDIAGEEMIEYKLFAAQAGLVFGVNLIGSYLALDLGPQLQYNSKLELTNDTQEGYFINGYDGLEATDISDINRFNVNGMAGVTATFGRFRIRGQYIYGLMNSFDKLNDKNLVAGSTMKFKGNINMMTLSAFFIF